MGFERERNRQDGVHHFCDSTFESIGRLLVSYVNKGIPRYGRGAITDREISATRSKESE
jgi:hypothetical protein